MATEGHEHGERGADLQKKIKTKIDKDLIQIRERMEQLTLKMQQETKVHWRYEWGLNKKEKWPIQKLLARKKQQAVRRWMRYD
jgi:hypothetical protein